MGLFCGGSSPNEFLSGEGPVSRSKFNTRSRFPRDQIEIRNQMQELFFYFSCWMHAEQFKYMEAMAMGKLGVYLAGANGVSAGSSLARLRHRW